MDRRHRLDTYPDQTFHFVAFTDPTRTFRKICNFFITCENVMPIYIVLSRERQMCHNFKILESILLTEIFWKKYSLALLLVEIDPD